MRTAQEPEQRFWRFVKKTDNCWIWTGHKDRAGYGTFGVPKGRMLRAHRYSWKIAHGEIPDSQILVMHKCDNPSCVNPEHLFLGSQKDNSADKVSKNRQAKGSHQGLSKVTEDQVHTIRDRYIHGQRGGLNTTRRLSKEFGISLATVKQIVSGKTWKHVH